MTDVDHSYGGRYRVIERVGSGGMAEVYRARDELLGREVAVKVLSERFSRDRSFVERFRREAQSAANLNHPNIVSLYDYGADNGTYFIVMEFIDGKPLGDVIHDEGPLMPERAAEVAADVAQALDRAHASGLVHRDIKSSNIMFTSTGQTKVTDFGIARALGTDGEQTMTQTGMVIGTAAYLSPEQAQGNPVDARSDVYSLGVVLYEMVTGATPFSGETPLSIAYKHVREDPRPPSAVNRDVPRELDSITLKALAKNPENRYSSAAEMRDDLRRYLSGQRVHATPLMAAETSVLPARTTGTQVLSRTEAARYEEPEPPRRAGWYVLIAVLALALIGLAAYLLAGSLFGGEEVEVPDVVGMTEREAVAELRTAGLEADPRDRTSRKPVGEVIAQEPEAGESIEEGGTVEIVVSAGPREVTVPPLEGLTEEQARDAIDEANLEVGRVTPEPSDEVEEGLVISSSPEAGDDVPAGTEVDLVVSGGAETVSVPPVVGLSEEDARQALEAADLVPEVVTEPSGQPEGQVFAQDPLEGSEVEAGSTVRITVSEGPEQAMPNVVGMDADEAEALLAEEYGLEVDRQAADIPCAQPPGTVCDQEPPEGTPVEPGDTVTIFVLE